MQDHPRLVRLDEDSIIIGSAIAIRVTHALSHALTLTLTLALSHTHTLSLSLSLSLRLVFVFV
jgi:hypothetical protein